MNDNVENLILQQLREMRSKMDLLGENVADLRKGMDEGLSDLTQRVDGVAIILTMLAGHVHHIDERVEALEGKTK